MPAPGTRHPPEALGRGGTISRSVKYGLRKRRELERRAAELERLLWSASPADLRALVESDAIPDAAKPWAELAAATTYRLRRAAEGEPGTPHHKPLSEPRVALLQTAERLLLMGSMQMARSLQASDGREAAATAGQLLAKYAALVKDAIGLDPEVDATPSLSTYLAERATKPSNGSDPDPEYSPGDDLPAQGSAARLARTADAADPVQGEAGEIEGQSQNPARLEPTEGVQPPARAGADSGGLAVSQAGGSETGGAGSTHREGST